MRIENKMYCSLRRLDKLPVSWREMVQTRLMGRFVPFLSTAGLRFEQLSRESVRVSIRNRRAVQNHIKGVHACAMALLAETATGFAVQMNVPDDKLILLKSMNIQYVKRSVGNMHAVARISDEMAARLQTEERGNFVVPCEVGDESGEPPVLVEMVWAWVPKKHD
ncbi:hypothetical protein PL75_09375 [Neisseria arctica]|uniref:DUF4442 domain-containing protein n=1 Tax=Neisseria arctica TaxID=1470200 RepID=A0A0J0YQ05_9NEIS|nr:DUF4442 domain-containing protein [Neisseria arctica]KLT72209.1 hypothetical protein PL75_09375 [Neisseria arctica]UOO86682.1 DUF4442 domain-containing protein [Neisseria arctica]